jgi:hypothetical protein
MARKGVRCDECIKIGRSNLRNCIKAGGAKGRRGRSWDEERNQKTPLRLLRKSVSRCVKVVVTWDWNGSWERSCPCSVFRAVYHEPEARARGQSEGGHRWGLRRGSTSPLLPRWRFGLVVWRESKRIASQANKRQVVMVIDEPENEFEKSL